MENGYPRYPIDSYRLRVPFLGAVNDKQKLPTVIADIVRENPFGTAFVGPKKREQTSENFS